MLILRKILFGLLIGIATPSLLWAQSAQASLERQITAQGYEVILSETTWLGRLRILAVRGDLMREIVIGPGTGEVLRDVVYMVPGLAVQLANADTGEGGRPVVNMDRLGTPEVLASGLPDPVADGGGGPVLGVGTTDITDPSDVVPSSGN